MILREWVSDQSLGAVLNATEKMIGGGRKHLLFAAACLRRLRDAHGLLQQPHHALGIESLERRADGDEAERKDRAITQDLVRRAMQTPGPPDLSPAGRSRAAKHAHAAGYLYRALHGGPARNAVKAAEATDFPQDEQKAIEGILRCVFGSPFPPTPLSPTWLTDTAVGIARGIYDDRAFDRLPILADALQDGGCEDEAVLGHCRGPGPHVPGCWVVDAVLG